MSNEIKSKSKELLEVDYIKAGIFKQKYRTIRKLVKIDKKL
jgi:hypothetical protein